ncbi:protein tramtrack: beta isoform-like protein [Dinothrombium tinctorium]|uniref:Protein tramtrack: beta isoform-like protein n=1 Tax=Dinothrombium tinctorium TaxID=1965070 RepID=A0A3S3RLN0_9ACAR|nr:protein tramtrack: beta isoform-like protein [Dinothrombium tinctorium]RWS05041.1 protein tramtrack: beta isoform-like protein [Dinothrombium tinctorium]RWS05791.1 protein tramtrack: beta isoform-like protein [Dinothrombium tinctorium]
MSSPSNEAQAYCLRRNNHSLDMVEELDKMYKEETMVDVTLSCDEGSIRAHRMVLSASSPYFRTVFAKLITHSFQYPIVIIKDMPYADLKAIIEFIYRGEVTVPQEQLPSVLKSAEALQVKGLSDSYHSKEGKSSNGHESGSRKRRKKRRKISRSESSSNGGGGGSSQQQQQEHQGTNSDDEVLSGKTARDSSEDISEEYSDEDDEVIDASTNITPVNQRQNEERPFSENNNTVEPEIEPSRLLEQTMITGDAQENGNSVPRFSSSVNVSNVQPIASVSSQDVKPLLFDESAAFTPQLTASSMSASLPPNEPQALQQQANSQNHLPPVTVPCTLSAFESSALSSIPGPSTISHIVSRPSQAAQENRERRKSTSSSSQKSSSLSRHSNHFQCHSSSRQRFHCHICHQGFTAKRNLQRHMQIHSYYRNKYECEICRKIFSWKHTLNNHKEKAHNIHV